MKPKCVVEQIYHVLVITTTAVQPKSKHFKNKLYSVTIQGMVGEAVWFGRF